MLALRLVLGTLAAGDDDVACLHEQRIEAAADRDIAGGGNFCRLLRELALELVEAEKRRREIGADAHHVIRLDALVLRKVAAFEIDELVRHMLAHVLVERRAIVAHGTLAGNRDDGPGRNLA